MLDYIERLLPSARGTVVLHWFTGSAKQASRAVDMGCYFSLNPWMLRTPRHERLVHAIPLDRIFTETDAPFARGARERADYGMVRSTIDQLAELHDIPTIDIVTTLHKNFRRLLQP